MQASYNRTMDIIIGRVDLAKEAVTEAEEAVTRASEKVLSCKEYVADEEYLVEELKELKSAVE